MDKLQEARQTINKVDKQMAELFEQRMEAVKIVAEYKKERGLPILDRKREEQVIDNNSVYIKKDDVRSYYVQFMKNMMKVSRAFQHRLIKGDKVAYCGVEGAFAQIAARKIFPDAKLVSYPSFKAAYEAVENRECTSVVLPIENSYAGEVGQVVDLMYTGFLTVNGVYDLRIQQNLLAKKNTEMDDIKTVISHPQALAQCEKYIKEHHLLQVQASNTALAAKQVAESKDNSIAAIASFETANLYGLKVVDFNINQSDSNTTRFAVFSSIPNKQVKANSNCFILLFMVDNTAGSLAKAIDIIGKHGFNMRVLRSRPDKESAWSYYFYAEVEGKADSTQGKKMIKELKTYCPKLKVVGNYDASVDMKTIQEKR